MKKRATKKYKISYINYGSGSRYSKDIEFLEKQNKYLKVAIQYHKQGVMLSHSHLVDNLRKIATMKSYKPSKENAIYTWTDGDDNQ